MFRHVYIIESCCFRDGENDENYSVSTSKAFLSEDEALKECIKILNDEIDGCDDWNRDKKRPDVWINSDRKSAMVKIGNFTDIYTVVKLEVT